MLMPKKTKFRKVQKGRIKGRAKGGRTVAFGEYGLLVIDPARVSAQQIEATRVAITRHLKKVGKLYLRLFPHKPVTKKPAETRMGKGKGNVDHWVDVVKRGRVICEVAGLSQEDARKVLKAAAYKLPMKTKVVKRGQELKV